MPSFLGCSVHIWQQSSPTVKAFRDSVETVQTTCVGKLSSSHLWPFYSQVLQNFFVVFFKLCRNSLRLLWIQEVSFLFPLQPALFLLLFLVILQSYTQVEREETLLSGFWLLREKGICFCVLEMLLITVRTGPLPPSWRCIIMINEARLYQMLFLYQLILIIFLWPVDVASYSE